MTMHFKVDRCYHITHTHLSISPAKKGKPQRTRPSTLGMSDPVIESQEIKETQEFPSIQNVEGGEEDERREGSERDDEKQ